MITKLSRQGPASHRGDAHKVEFLRNAVVGSGWSHEPLSRVATHGLSFQQLYGELEAALQLQKEAKQAMLRDAATKTKDLGYDDEVPGILFAGQTRYAKHPSRNRFFRGSRGFSTPSSRPRTSFDPLSIQGCFNCEDKTHTIRDCPRPINAGKAAANKLDYFRKRKQTGERSVHLVLAQLCQQLDQGSASGTREEVEEKDIPEKQTDREIFECILEESSQYEVDCTSPRPLHSNETLSQEEDSLHLYFSQQDREDYVFVVYEGDTASIFKSDHVFGTDKDVPFLGACIDTGAQKAVIGKKQALAYFRLIGEEFRRRKHGHGLKFKFGNRCHIGLGRVEIRIPINGTYVLCPNIEVVDVDVPLLLGLDFLDEYKMIVDAANDLLESKIRAWSFLLTRKLGHIYLEWDYGTFYTSEELLKLHKHFFHPDSGRLYAMLKRADNASTTPSDLKELERVASECDVCQRNMAAPSRFRTALPADDVVFNRCVCMDIMFLEGKAVLHMVDKDTKFSAAAFLPKQTVDELWSTYLSHCVLPYIGHALEIHADQGPQFRSRRFASYTSMEGVQLRLSGVKSHNSLGVGERYHHYLRRIFRKIRDDFPDIPMKDALGIATKAMNDTAGPKGLVPSLLVFGVMPRILLPGSVQLPGQVQRMNAMQAARNDMSKEVARSRLSTALRSNVPAATNRDISIGSEVLVFKEPPVNKWVGPFHVLDVRDKSVFINSQGRTMQMSIEKVKPYLRPIHNETPSTTEPSQYNPNNNTISKGLSPAEASNAWLESLRDLLQDLFSSPAEDNAISPDEFDMEFATFLTEVIESSDPRSKSAAFLSAMKKEVRGLEDRGVWVRMSKKDLPENANVLGGRFVLTLKNAGSERETPKARFVAQGFSDREKDYIIHNVTSLRQSSVRMIASFAASKRFRIFSHDVTQAYTQSDECLSRELYLQPNQQVPFYSLSMHAKC